MTSPSPTAPFRTRVPSGTRTATGSTSWADMETTATARWDMREVLTSRGWLTLYVCLLPFCKVIKNRIFPKVLLTSQNCLWELTDFCVRVFWCGSRSVLRLISCQATNRNAKSLLSVSCFYLRALTGSTGKATSTLSPLLRWRSDQSTLATWKAGGKDRKTHFVKNKSPLPQPPQPVASSA